MRKMKFRHPRLQPSVGVFIMLLAAILFNSCSMVSEDTGVDPSGAMSAKVDGDPVSYADEMVRGTFSYVSNATYLTITCITPCGAQLWLQRASNGSVTEIGEVDNYTLKYIDGTEEWVNNSYYQSAYPASFEFTDYTGDRVKGRFSFTGLNPDDSTTMMITDGLFDVRIE